MDDHDHYLSIPAIMRKTRLEWLSSFLKEHIPMDRNELLGKISLKFGTSERTAKEYLKAVMFVDGYIFEGELIIKKPYGVK